jgi:hypothetical protein
MEQDRYRQVRLAHNAFHTALHVGRDFEAGSAIHLTGIVELSPALSPVLTGDAEYVASASLTLPRPASDASEPAGVGR